MSHLSVILTTYKRLGRLQDTLQSLLEQSHKDFTLHIIHNDPTTAAKVRHTVNQYKRLIDIRLSIHKNNTYSFRRHMLGQELANAGEKIIVLIDDDVDIPKDYLSKALAQHKPGTVISSHAYAYITRPPVYGSTTTDRIKVSRIQPDNVVGHCGAGMSVVDASIYLYEDFFDKDIVENYMMFDDIWLSYFALSKGFSLNYFDSGAVLNGEDDVALYKQIMHGKRDFFKMLVNRNNVVPTAKRTEIR